MQTQRRKKCERWWRTFLLPRVLEAQLATQEMVSIKTRSLEALECGDVDGLISIMHKFEKITQQVRSKPHASASWIVCCASSHAPPVAGWSREFAHCLVCPEATHCRYQEPQVDPVHNGCTWAIQTDSSSRSRSAIVTDANRMAIFFTLSMQCTRPRR